MSWRQPGARATLAPVRRPATGRLNSGVRPHEKLMQVFKKLLLVILTIGWLAPMWLACWLFVDFWQVEGMPTIYGRNPGNSFEWFDPIKFNLSLAFGWLSAVTAYWAWTASTALKRGRGP
jgi:hypothetical protein